jgi:recombination protein RecA
MKDNLKKLLHQLEKDYNVKRASEIEQEEMIKTGIHSLDHIFDGGIRLCEGGHKIEFFGAESTGKSTFALHIVKKYQKLGKVCAYIDAEHSYDKEWGEIIGVDNDNLIVVSPNSLEEVGDLFVKLIPEVDLIIIDSIVGLIPEEEINRDTNEPTMGLQARVNALITRKIYRTIAHRKTTMIFINQLREKIGVMYGNPYTTGGGRALKHMYNTRVEFKLGKPIDTGSGDKKERIGYEINLKCVKNKKGKPYHTAVVDFYFTGNIDNKKSIFFNALRLGVIELSGKTYTFGEKTAVGKDNFLNLLTDKDLEKIEKELWKRAK